MSNQIENKQINKEFAKYAVPSIIAMIVQALYTVLDGVIIGQGIGPIALGAANIILPFCMVVLALAMFIAFGGANVYSIYKGKGENEKANNIFCQSLAISAIIGIVLAAVGFVFSKDIATFLGANQELLPSATAYLQWMAPFTLLQMIVFGITVFVRNDNAPKLVMIASAVGAIANVALDAVFILIFHYGIEVAALTNGIGFLITGLFFIPYFLSKKGTLRIQRPQFDSADIKRVFSNGFATLLTEFSLPAVTFSYNLAIINSVGTEGVSAYSVVVYVSSFILMLLVGVTQGAQPLMSFYHGKGDKKVFSHIYRLGVRTSIIASILLVGACAVFGEGIVSLFITGNPELVALTAHMFRLYALAYIVIGVTLMNILYFQTTEQNTYSTALSFLRCIGFTQLFLVLSAYVFDASGLYLTFLAGEACNLVISVVFMRQTLKDSSP